MIRDPFENFNFRVKVDGNYVVGVSRVSPLRRTTQVVEHREGGDSSVEHRLPGRTNYDPITLERAVSSDATFEHWANSVSTPGSTARDFRKDVTIDILDETGTLVRSYHVHRCWVSEYQALPQLDADANSVLIEHIKLENEGWERDASVVPPIAPINQTSPPGAQPPPAPE